MCVWPCVCLAPQWGLLPRNPVGRKLPEEGVVLQWEWDLQGMVQVAVSMSVHTRNVWVSRAEPVRPWKLPAFHWLQERACRQLPGTL